VSQSLIDRLRSYAVPEGAEERIQNAPLDCDCGPDDIAALQEIIGEVGKQLITLKEGLARLIDEVPKIDRAQMVEQLEELIRDASV
jgi:hypothetical protein